MKTNRIVLSLFLLLTVILTACRAQVAIMEAKPKDAMAVEAMEDNGDEMAADQEDVMAQKDDAMMEEKDDTMMEDDDDPMMEDKDDAMVEGEEDNTMDDHDGAMKGDGEAMMDDDDSVMEDDNGTMMKPDWFKVTLTDARSGESFSIAGFKGQVVLVETLAMWCSNCLKQQGQVSALHDLLGERDDFVSLGIDIDPNENLDTLKTYIENNGFSWNYTVAPAEVAREIGQLYGDQFLNPPSTPMLIIDSHGEVHPLPFGIKSAEELLEALEPFLSKSM
jgi:hypothetical protein